MEQARDRDVVRCASPVCGREVTRQQLVAGAVGRWWKWLGL
jgi:hypothetical protein